MGVSQKLSPTCSAGSRSEESVIAFFRLGDPILSSLLQILGWRESQITLLLLQFLPSTSVMTSSSHIRHHRLGQSGLMQSLSKHETLNGLRSAERPSPLVCYVNGLPPSIEGDDVGGL